ncbi:MAG: GTP 3',8-cyclase MoaA [Clostridiales Family XIII bacterium]|jgi:cyclic pyranopterin phosphate synthase|nr:GTP 3',8-cyclase MoaA [Clostridiales Family XIII bacterium]
MIDRFGRNINYLRLSVTDLCNLRCIYCMPEEGVVKRSHYDILTVEEIGEIVDSAASLGITKIRLTGGEPLVRRGILDIVRKVAGTPGIEEVCLTTNGVLLPQMADELKSAGVDRVNISMDSLDPETYQRITRIGTLEAALYGVRAALEAGLTPIKINAVLMGGVNTDDIRPLIELTKQGDISVRFIEVMPVGECAEWSKERFVNNDMVLDMDPALEFIGTNGVSRLYRHRDGIGSVGLISPISAHFCPGCNKIRVTSDGKLKPCLHSSEEIPIKGLRGAALTEAIRNGILGKPLKHNLGAGNVSESLRNMNAIGG